MIILKIENINCLSYPPLDQTNIDNRFKCSYCKKLIVNVHQADDCGCRYCHDCLDFITKENTCKGCKFPLFSDFKVPDRYFQRKIGNLNVNCFFKECLWTGSLLNYRDHYNEHFELLNLNDKNKSKSSLDNFLFFKKVL